MRKTGRHTLEIRHALKKKKEFKRLLVRDSKAKNNGLFISTERARSARGWGSWVNGSCAKLEFIGRI